MARKSIGGSGAHTELFDDADILSFEDGNAEYVREKHRSEDEDPLPMPYSAAHSYWVKSQRTRPETLRPFQAPPRMRHPMPGAY